MSSEGSPRGCAPGVLRRAGTLALAAFWLGALALPGCETESGMGEDEIEAGGDGPGADAETPSPEYTDEQTSDLDLGTQLEVAQIEYSAAIERLEEALPNLTGSRRARMLEALEELSELMRELGEAREEWARASEEEREALAPELENLLDALDAGLIRAEGVLGPELGEAAESFGATEGEGSE